MSTVLSPPAITKCRRQFPVPLENPQKGKMMEDDWVTRPDEMTELVGVSDWMFCHSREYDGGLSEE